MALDFMSDDDSSPEVFQALVLGVQGVGKTTTCSSFARFPTLLLYSKLQEPHAVRYAKNGTSLFKAIPKLGLPAATADNIMPVAFDVYEKKDTQMNFGFRKMGPDKTAVDLEPGDKLSSDQVLIKLYAYIARAHEFKGIKSIVIDSLTGFFVAVKESTKFKKMCTTDKGTYNNWNEKDAYIDAHNSLVENLVRANDKGINTACILGAQYVEPGVENSPIKPYLPMYAVAEAIPARYQDILPIVFNPDGPSKTLISFGTSVQYTIKNKDTKGVEKFVSFEPRIHCKPTSLEIASLEPDFFTLKPQVEAHKARAEKKAKGNAPAPVVAEPQASPEPVD